MHRLHRLTNREEKQCGREGSDFEQRTWLQVFLQIFYFAVGIDPFLIYKVDDKRARVGGGKTLPMARERLDRLREVWRTTMAILCLPIGAHLLIIGGARVLDATWMETIRNKECSDGRTHESSGRAERLFEQLGDPLGRSVQLASVISLILPVVTVLVLVALPKHLRHSPLDATASRFLIKPKVEIQQQDQLVRQKLLTIQTSYKLVNLQMFYAIPKEKMYLFPSSPAERRILQRLESQYQLVHEGHLERGRISRFRLASYTAASYKRLDRFGKLFVSLVLVGGILSNSLIGASLYILAWASSTAKHPMVILHELDIKSIFREINWRQHFTLVEIIFITAMNTVGVSGLVSGFFFQAYEQLGWINDIGGELKSLLVLLRHRVPSIADEWSGEKKADCELLKVLVHLSIFARLVRRSTRTQTMLLSMIIAISAVCATSVLISRMLLPPDPYWDIQLPIMGCIWLYTNAILLTVSAMPSRVIRMKKVVWSILAEQARAHEEAGKCQPDTISLFVELWRKQVLSEEFVSNNYPIRALGIGLTFNKVRQANFLLLTIFSWLQTRD